MVCSLVGTRTTRHARGGGSGGPVMAGAAGQLGACSKGCTTLCAAAWRVPGRAGLVRRQWPRDKKSAAVRRRRLHETAINGHMGIVHRIVRCLVLSVMDIWRDLPASEVPGV